MSRVQDYGTWDTVDDPVVTQHAAQQWDRRTPPESVAPETAWREAWEMRLEAHPDYHNIHETRFHRPTETVFLRITGVIRTILAASGPESERIVRDAVANQFGIALTDS